MNSRNYSPYRSDWNIFEYLPCCPNVNEINLVDVIGATAPYSCMRVPACFHRSSDTENDYTAGYAIDHWFLDARDNMKFSDWACYFVRK